MATRKFRSVFREDLFEGQVVFVTGGGTGLGRCTAHELASLGATVVIGGRHEESLESTAAEIRELGGTCDFVRIDIRDEEQVDEAVSTIVGRHGRLDGLVNNAGGQFAALVADMRPKGWRTVVDLNLNGTFLVSTAAYRHWMKDHGGAIVNMLADIWTGFPGWGHSAAARAGIENLSRTLSLEWSSSGVRINCVAPGTILSSGMLKYPEPVQKYAVDSIRETPMARFGTESEVSAAIVFLLSPAAAYVTAETIRIDGGSRFQKPRLIPIGGHQRGPRPWNGFPYRPNLRGTLFEEFGED